MAISAVITADIVGSTQLSKTTLTKLLASISQVLEPYQHEFFRGDSFQAYLPAAADAFDVVLQVRLSAMKLQDEGAAAGSDIRAAIGLGNVSTAVKNLGTTTDEAFVLSGRLFETLQAGERLLIAAPETFPAINTSFRLLAGFTDFILQRLTAKQAEVVYELLAKKTQLEIAKKLKKSQATVHQHAQAAGWPALEKLSREYALLTQSLIL